MGYHLVVWYSHSKCDLLILSNFFSRFL